VPEVFQSTIADLQHHADILDAMGIPSFPDTKPGQGAGILIVHGGGTYGDKAASKARWILQFASLPEAVRRRLAIENDETQYNVSDCLEIAEKCGIPMVFDCHHYDCYQSTNPEGKDAPMTTLIERVYNTWKGTRPLMHISAQAKDARLGAHSEYIDVIPDEFLGLLARCPTSQIDLEVEAKRKEQAILNLWYLYPALFPAHKTKKLSTENLNKVTLGNFVFEKVFD
jgi:UV DNA damage endonuclease